MNAPAPAWRKSSHSIANGDCIEVGNSVTVRDSKNPAVVLTFTAAAWRAFTAEVRQA